jgi:hypothetical protein
VSEESGAAESPGYRIAREHLAEIQARYDALVDACDAYIAALRAEQEQAARDPSLPPAYATRIGGHIASGSELLQVLETFAHDALIRASDRTAMIQIAYEGRFV